MNYKLSHILPWWLLAACVAPNVAVCMAEPMAWATAAINLLLPCGVYMLLMSLSGRIGRTVWFFLPVLFLAAFQVVLLYLFGGTVIAVDMWLNMVTSNPSEMGELLGDMWVIILVVVVVIVPLLVLGAVAWKRREAWSLASRRRWRLAGALFAAVGMALCFVPSALAVNKLFPVNALENAHIAVERSQAVRHYAETSAGYRFNAVSAMPDSVPELYIVVIGETARADNWQLQGYKRPTNPRLSTRRGLIYFPHVMSEANATHKSVPMLLSGTDATTIDSIYCRRGLIAAFREAGFNTLFISGQERNGQMIDLLGQEADTCIFLRDSLPSGVQYYDFDLLPAIARHIAACPAHKQLVVVHTYGSHFRYNDRYPEEYRRFTPDAPLITSATCRDRLVNAYDNTIAYTDAFLDSLISLVDARGVVSALLYTSDHGEDIFDDPEGRHFLHASPVPTLKQLHVPMVLWFSDAWHTEHPDKVAAACANTAEAISSSASLFHTALDLASISSTHFNPRRSVVSRAYHAPERVYVNDHNKPVYYSTGHGAELAKNQ